MSLEKFSKQLQRELKRNPQQAAVLALLGLVAVWFWLPLIWKQDETVSTIAVPSATSSPAQAQPSASGLSTATLPPGSAPTATTTAAAPLRWDEVMQAIHDDPLMQPITVLTAAALDRSPFAVYQHPQTTEPDENAETSDSAIAPPVVEVVVTPEEAGLQLSGTIVSRMRGSATINGQAFRQGEVIEGKAGEQFVLTAIDATSVTLERNGHKFKLAIRRTVRSGRIELQANE